MAPAKGPRSKTVVDPPVMDPPATDPPAIDLPAADGAKGVAADAPTLPSDKLSKPAGDNATNGSGTAESVSNINAAGSSGLTVNDKANDTQSPIIDNDGFIEDDSDEEMEVDLDLEATIQLRTTLILLFPINLVVAKETASIIDAVKMLIKRGWNAELSAEAQTSTKFQVLSPDYVAKTRFGRLLVSFTLQSDAETVKTKEVLYQRINGAGRSGCARKAAATKHTRNVS
ncbi:unnamed protein product [Closterium sp. Naga37s-1]|nr:unnamed protein product [Closterium sp. Naga37s-1]